MNPDFDESHAFAVCVVGHGTLAPGAVGGMLEQTYEFTMRERQAALVQHALPAKREGDVVLVVCAPGRGYEYVQLIHAAINDPDVG